MRQSAAKKILKVIPLAVKTMRREMREFAGPDLSVPQFRVLANIHHGTTGTSALAKLHGISVPAMSKIVEGLVKRGLICRIPDEKDRRAINLAHTEQGERLFLKISGSVEKKFVKALEGFSEEKCHVLLEGLAALEEFFTEI